MREFGSPSSPLHTPHKYDTDVTLWLHASKTTCESIHRNNSNERQFGPPGSAAKPPGSPLESVCIKTSVPRSGGNRVFTGNGSSGNTTAAVGATMVRSSSRRNWDMMYKSCRSVPYAFRMSRCRRVLVNIPKHSLKTGINERTRKGRRVRVCKSVIDWRCGRYFFMYSG